MEIPCNIQNVSRLLLTAISVIKSKTSSHKTFLEDFSRKVSSELENEPTRTRAENVNTSKNLKKSELEAHLKSDCQYVPVVCPHEGCDERMLQAMLTAHTKTCPHRPVTCQDCSKDMPHCELVVTHGNICPARRVPCPNCGREIARRHMARHCENVCEKAPVTCPYGAPLGPSPHARVSPLK